MEKINVIIADDHRLFADGLTTILQQSENIHILAIASTGAELITLLERYEKVDLVLLDVSMPDINGLQAAEKIVERYHGLPILVITMNDAPDVLVNLMNIGVKGILFKNTGKPQLLEAIAEILKGKNYFSPEVAQQLAKGYGQDKEDMDKWQLTKREKEILQLIYNGLSTAEMADKLFISPYTVETHRKNLLVKTGFNKSSQLIKQALELGYITVEDARS